MSERIYATEITSEGNTMCVRVTAQMLDARINLGVVVETQNAEPRQGQRACVHRRRDYAV
jgi:hypothetical protein